MICVLGKTASGKDTIVKELVRRGYGKVVTYTTRPMRDGEEDGEDYHFINESTFTGMIDRGGFAEWKSYDTAFGRWYYGVALDDLEEAEACDILIITPSGYKDILEYLPYKPTAIYIYCNNATQTERLKRRGDDPAEIQRRIKQDNIDFRDLPEIVDQIFYNNDGDLEGVVKKIVNFLHGEDRWDDWDED